MNFGDHRFAYAEGHAYRDAADVNRGDSLEEIMALFKLLPFHPSDEEEEVKEKETKESDETDDVNMNRYPLDQPYHYTIGIITT